MKKPEHDMTGSDQISEHVETAGWGVEEADKANKMDASMSILPSSHTQTSILVGWR
jgi:hypothetical protein